MVTIRFVNRGVRYVFEHGLRAGLTAPEIKPERKTRRVDCWATARQKGLGAKS